MTAELTAKNRFWSSFKEIILFTLPIIATGILQLLYNAADIIVVGQFAGEIPMAAVGSTSSIVNLFTSLFLGISVGVLSTMSRAIGAKEQDYADKVVHASIPVSVIGGVAIGLMGIVFCEGLLRLMQSPENILPLSAVYLKIYFAGMPFMGLYNFGASILRACGDTKRPLIILAISGVVNVILNYILVAWFSLGAIGVAVGTIASQIISAIAVLVLLAKRQGYGKFSFRKMNLSSSALKEVMAIGIPAGLQTTLFSISNVIIQSSINSFGDKVIAGNSAAASIESFILSVLTSVSQACLTFVSRNYGAKDIKQMRLSVYQSLLMLVASCLLLGALSFIFAEPLVSIYNGDGEVIFYGAERLRVIAATYVLCGTCEIFVGALRGMGVSVLPMVCAVIGYCGLRVFWIFVVFAVNTTTFILYLSYPFSWLITGCVHLICYLIIRKKKEMSIKEQLVEKDKENNPPLIEEVG